MKIDSLFYGELRLLVGGNARTFSLNKNAELKDFIDKLNELYGDEFRAQIETDKKYLIFVNGQHIEVIDGMSTILNSGDQVVFIPNTVGG